MTDHDPDPVLGTDPVGSVVADDGVIEPGEDRGHDGIEVTADGATVPGFRSRAIGLVAVLLGMLGLVVSLLVAILVVRAGFTATSTVDSLLEPVAMAIDRVETRIDQADDVVDRSGVPADTMPELRARSEALSDGAISARSIFDAVDDHPIYGRLPADVGPLRSALDDFAERTVRIDDVVEGVPGGTALGAAGASVVADELNTMQAAVSDTAEAVDSAKRSLKRWIRLGAFSAFCASLWSCWAQLSLARRGAHTLRGRPG